MSFRKVDLIKTKQTNKRQRQTAKYLKVYILGGKHFSPATSIAHRRLRAASARWSAGQRIHKGADIRCQREEKSRRFSQDHVRGSIFTQLEHILYIDLGVSFVENFLTRTTAGMSPTFTPRCVHWLCTNENKHTGNRSISHQS